jgi:hypothetical protein
MTWRMRASIPLWVASSSSSDSGPAMVREPDAHAAVQKGHRETAFFIPGSVRKRTEPLSTEEDSRIYDARHQNFWRRT